MSRFLFAWEYGTGLGHVGKFLPIALTLKDRGHQVVAAVKNIPSVRSFAGRHPGFPVLSAPAKSPQFLNTVGITSTYYQLLHNLGFSDQDFLYFKIQEWLDLFAVVKPDLVVCDHSPVAMLAARIADLKNAVIGTGFTCPPATPFLPILDEVSAVTQTILQEEENALLKKCNHVSSRYGGKPLSTMGDLYSQATATFLLTHQELDHFPARTNPTYWGTWNFVKGVAIEYPAGAGPKVFGYLKPAPSTDAILEELRCLKWPALIVGTSFTSKFVEEQSSESLTVTNQPVDHERAVRWSDFAILNASHASVAITLRAGKPILCLPLQTEQCLMARRVVDMRMGEAVLNGNEFSCSQALKLMEEQYPTFTVEAEHFSARYRNFDAKKAVALVTEQMEYLV